MVITIAVRGLQLIFAAVVIGLSGYLIGSYGPGSAPAIVGYGVFCGAAGLVIAIVGLVSVWMDFLQGIIMLALDGFAAFFLVAGGIAYAVKLKVGSCTKDTYLRDGFGVFGQSTQKDYDTTNSKKWAQRFLDDTISRCRISQAETAFIWFLFATFLVTVVLAFFNRSGKRGGAIV